MKEILVQEHDIIDILICSCSSAGIISFLHSSPTPHLSPLFTVKADTQVCLPFR